MVLAVNLETNTMQVDLPEDLIMQSLIVDAGLLGKISHAEICCYYHMRARGNPPDTTPPTNLDYEMWTGPAPMRPYHPDYCPFKWRGWWDYGCGALGDMGCHIMDPAFWALDLSAPSSVECTFQKEKNDQGHRERKADQDQASGRHWLQEGSQPRNPYGAGQSVVIPWPDPMADSE